MPYKNILSELAGLIEKRVLDIHERIPIALFETPPSSTLGDIALPCFFLAKTFKKNPVQIALDIACAIQKNPSELIERTEAKGPYVNFFLSAKLLARKTLVFADPLRGLKQRQNKRSIVLEYVSPNTNKPLHLGHVRNAFLGDSIARLLKATGQKVHKTCLVNDRGIHICKSMVAYQHRGKKQLSPKTENKKGDHFVGDCYVFFEKTVKKNPSWQTLAAECLKKWESGDKPTRALWKKMNTWTLKGFADTYKTLGISFDKTYYESALYNKGRDSISAAVKKGIFKKDESGAILAHLGEYGLPDKVLLRKDGTAIYITQDIYLAYKRAKDFKNARTLYVVGSEQDTYFRQLFAILKCMGFKGAQDLVHVSYGIVNLPEGRMKSREGTVVDADDLISRLKTMVFNVLDARDEKLEKKERLKRAERIALAALKYYILEVGPASDMTFNPKESISFQGRTGPYIQYTYARLKSIIRKSALSARVIKKGAEKGYYSWNAEKSSLILVAQFSSVVQDAAERYDPSILAKYLYGFAKVINEHYHTTPILTASEKEKFPRLALALYEADTLKKGLSLLGIDAVEKM